MLHLMVLVTAGINFVGSSMILMLCFDWNVLWRKATVVYDGDCGFCKRTLSRIAKFDWFGRLSSIPSGDAPDTLGLDPERLHSEMGLVDENGEIYYGADAFEQIGARVPLLYPYALMMKLPGFAIIARRVYAWVSANRRMVSSVF